MLNEEIELEKGISLDVVKNISEIKGEPNWMKEFRMESYKFFEKCMMPSFGPELNIDFNNITYYKRISNKSLIIGKVLDVMLKILLIISD